MKKIFIIILFLISCSFINVNATNATEYIDVRNLPETTGSYLSIINQETGSIGKVSFAKRMLTKNGQTVPYFYLTMTYNGNVYYSKTNLPHADKLGDSFEGYYYTERDGLGNVNRFLYYGLPNDQYEYQPLLNDNAFLDYDIQPHAGKVFWNVTTGDTYTQDIITVYGRHRKGFAETGLGDTEEMYFLDFVLSIPTDSVISAFVNYQYRNVYWFNNKGKWWPETFVYHIKDRLWGFDKAGRPITVSDSTRVEESMGKYMLSRNRYLASKNGQTLQEFLDANATGQPMITFYSNPSNPTTEDLQIKAKFISDLNSQLQREFQIAQSSNNWQGINGIRNEALKRYIRDGQFTAYDVFNGTDGKIYSIPLRKVRDYPFAHDIDFKDFTFTDLIYEINGQYYHASESQILTIVPDRTSPQNPFENFLDWWDNIKEKAGQFFKTIITIIIIVLVVYAGIKILSFINVSKKSRK